MTAEWTVIEYTPDSCNIMENSYQNIRFSDFLAFFYTNSWGISMMSGISENTKLGHLTIQVIEKTSL